MAAKSEKKIDNYLEALACASGRGIEAVTPQQGRSGAVGRGVKAQSPLALRFAWLRPLLANHYPKRNDLEF